MKWNDALSRPSPSDLTVGTQVEVRQRGWSSHFRGTYVTQVEKQF